MELQAILKFQYYVGFRMNVLDGNHRTTQLLRTYFGFELANENKSIRLKTSTTCTSRIEQFKKYSFNYIFFCKELMEMDNATFANACKSKSESIQKSASMVIPHEPYHK